MITSTEYYESCTQLLPGAVIAYEEFHRAVPRRVDESLRAAGVLGWKIYRREDVLTHCVTVENRARMEALLNADPTSPWWQAQANTFLLSGVSPKVRRPFGRLIWDIDWPTREDGDLSDLST